MPKLRTYVSNGTSLYRVVDSWKGDEKEGPKVLVENCESGQFAWFPAGQVEQMMVVHDGESNEE